MTQTDKPPESEKPLTQPTPTPTSQPTEPTGQEQLTAKEKAKAKLKELGIDPTQELPKEKAEAIAKELGISPASVYEAKKDILAAPSQAALKQAETKPSSKLTAKITPIAKTVKQEPQESPKPPEKKPLTPQEIESNKKFFDRFLTWVAKKADAQVDKDDQDFIVGTYTDILTEQNSKVPLVVKLGIAVAMTITLYVIPFVNKTVGFISKAKEKLTKKPEQETPPKEVEQKP